MRIGDNPVNPYRPTLGPKTAAAVSLPSPMSDTINSASSEGSSPLKWLAIGALFLLFCAFVLKFFSRGGDSSPPRTDSEDDTIHPRESNRTGGVQKKRMPQSQDLHFTWCHYKFMKSHLSRQPIQPFAKRQIKVELHLVLGKITDESIRKHLVNPEIKTHKVWDRSQVETSSDMFFVFARYMEFELNLDPDLGDTPLREATERAEILKDIFAELYSC